MATLTPLVPRDPAVVPMRALSSLERRLTRIERHVAFGVCVGLATLVVLIAAGLQLRYTLAVFWADAIYTLVAMALVYISRHIYFLDRGE